jgi:hypothetical protein
MFHIKIFKLKFYNKDIFLVKANTGGLLGLFMGFSLLSIIEIFYYFTLRLWWRILKRKKAKNDKNRFIVQPFMNKLDTMYPFIE